jgi:hypothetical protein
MLLICEVVKNIAYLNLSTSRIFEFTFLQLQVKKSF